MATASPELSAPLPPRTILVGLPSLGTRIAYGFGAVTSGVKDNGLSYFLLLFYSQVIGVDARLVGLAITIGLVADALLDPAIGYWSDNLRTRWGRRHPLMYAAALPAALSYFLLWNPPIGWSDTALFFYLIGLGLFIRLATTLYEIPSAALAPEMTQSYDGRSTLLSLRYYFAWTGGNLMTVLMFGAIFPMFVTAAIPNGQFNRDAYALYGMIAAGLMFTAIMVSSVGTHSRIPYLQDPPAKRSMTLRKIFSEIIETLSNRSFIALFVASMFGAVAAGLGASLAFFFNIYFWGFSSEQIALLTLGIFISAIIGGVLAPIASRRLGKKRGAIVIGLMAFLGAPIPVVLRLTGILPAGDGVFWFVLVATIIDVGLIIGFQILSVSMMADLVEAAELKTGRRSEGLFFASTGFLGKLVQGLGVTLASFVLTAAGIAAGAKPKDVPPEAIWLLGAYYVPLVLSLWMAMIAALGFYRLTRADHEDNLVALAARKAAGA